MYGRWRTELAKGRERANELSDYMTALVWKMLVEVFGVGLVIGATIGGILVWLLTK